MFCAPHYPLSAGGAPILFWRDFLADKSDEDDAVIDEILGGNAEPPLPNTLSSIWNFGGATARVGVADTPFGDSSMPYMLSLDSTWEGAEQVSVNIEWTRSFWQRM